MGERWTFAWSKRRGCMPLVGTVALATALTVTACGTGPTTGRSTSPPAQPRAVHSEEGLASFYGRAFEGKKTASGVLFDKERLWAAHPSWPFGTRVRVTSFENGASVVVRVVDRGPTKENQREGVIIDLSRGAADRIGMTKEGRQRVRLDVLAWGKSE